MARTWAFTSTIAEANCPRCGALQGNSCTTPKGTKYNQPHVERSLRYRHIIGEKEWNNRHMGGN